MPRTDPRVDAYIAKAQPFARPILTHVRNIILGVSQEIVETMKWNSPSYEYKGLLCGFSGFKAHAKFGFWKHSQVVEGAEAKRWGFGHLKSVKDLPPRAQIVKYVRKAMKLNADGIAPEWRSKQKKRRPLPEPNDLKAALGKDAKAKTGWDALSPSHRREYIEWITGAKQEETRARRLATTIAQVAEGKSQNWKYERK